MTVFHKPDAPDDSLPSASSGLMSNRPLLMAARNSGQQRSKARNDVANECHRVAEDVFKHTGRDIRHLIPPVPEIVRLLKTEAVRHNSFDSETGKKFTNEYLTLRLAHDVYLFVSTGSGKKLDEELAQPYLDELNEKLKTIRPGQLVFHRLDRIFRTDLLVANTLHICKHLKITMIDGLDGVQAGDLAAIMAMLKARDSSEEAGKIPKKTRDGQRDNTDTDMSVNGIVRYGVAQVAPAGMMVVRRRASNGGRGKAELHFDTPSETYPKPDEVLVGLPEVFTEVQVPRKKPGKDGQPRFKNRKVRVDQVALVRFALGNLGRPGWDISDVGRALSEQGFSTHRLRLDNTPSTTFTAELVNGEFGRVMRPIIERLEFYRTGNLPIRFGVKDVEDLVITGCFPPDGLRWASEEDFERIDAFLAGTTGGGPARQGLAGVIVNTEAGPIPLRSAPASRRAGGPAYVFRPAEAGITGGVNLPALPHEVLADSIAEALAEHADQLLIPLVQHDLPEVEALRRKHHAAELKVERLEAHGRNLLAQLTRTDDQGQLLLSGAALEAVSRQYNEHDSTQVQPARDAAAQLNVELNNAIAAARSTNAPLHSTLLLRMVESLRNPTDTTYNDLWKGAITIDTITRTPIRVHDTAGSITRWQGTIRTSGGGHEFSAPFHGEYRDGAAAELDAKVDHAIEHLLDGVPFAAIQQTNARGVRLALAERLGFDSRYFGLPTCPDPRLVKIATRLAVDPDRNVDTVAVDLGEPVDLVARVLAQLTSGRPTWTRLVDTEIAEVA